MFDPFAGHNFENDGCTFSPDKWRGVDLSGCCGAHDVSFGNAATLGERLAANDLLAQCAAGIGAADWGALAWIACGLFALWRTYVLWRNKRKPTDEAN